MTCSPSLSHLHWLAEARVRAKARTLAWRLGLQVCDRDDLEQELWLILLVWWQDGCWRRRSAGLSPAALRRRVIEQVERVAAIVLRSHIARRVRLPREHPLAPWLEGNLAATPTADAHSADLRLDLEHVITGLTAEQRATCEHLKRRSGCQPLLLNDSTAVRHIAALRRVFASHHLHEYL